MKKCYINGIGCISGQKTYENGFLEEPIAYPHEDIIYVRKPEYKNYIPPVALRRLGAGVKNGMVAAHLCREDAGATMPEAIITGTGLGCMRDSEKFLRNMLDDGEQFLTPTSFVQSTHNTVAGQIALSLKCRAYNLNYVNSAASFPSALLDGLMQVQDGDARSVLVGGVDELADYTTYLYELVNHFGTDPSENRGSKAGEGASFFYLEEQKNASSYCEVVDVFFQNNLKIENTGRFLDDFLKRNSLLHSDVDVVILGNNSDAEFDVYYNESEKYFPNSSFLTYKHLFGEFLTVSGVALWLACKIFRHGEIPEVLHKDLKKESREIPHILIYNQYRGKDHSLILLRNV